MKNLLTVFLLGGLMWAAACSPDAGEPVADTGEPRADTDHTHILDTVEYSSEAMLSEDNPFSKPSSLPFEAPDFKSISEKHYQPAMEAGMAQQMEEIEAIAGNPEPPTFENTIVAMEHSGELLTRVQRVFFNMTSSHTNEKIQEIQSEMAPKFSDHSDNIRLNSDLFGRIETLYEQKEDLGLDEASEKLLKDTHRQFVRAGALLDEEEQKRIREINSELSSLTTEFQEKLLAMTSERAVIIEDESDLEGLSSDRIAAAREAAADRDHEGKYLLSITNTTRVPILTSLKDRDVRRRVWEASANRGTGENDGIDTRPMVLRLAELRAERAQLLGYENYAEYAIDPQTAETPGNVLDMLTDLIPSVRANTEREAEMIRQKMLEDGIDDEVMPWDWEYYAERVRESEYDIDDEEVRPYFELNRVLEDGVFYTMNRLYGISFEERFDLPVYHEDVRVFNVYDEDGEQLGLFYADYFERDSKRGGAWMSSFVGQSHLHDKKPVIVNVLNISRPAEGEPALISFDNVTTLFHEMGHGVHGLFSDVKYPSQAMTSVPRDFVEFPSTFEEDWAIHPEVLANYAIHYETGEQIPEDLLDRVIAAREFNQGFETQEYLAATMIDMEWHTLPPDEIPDDVIAFENQAMAKYDLDYKPVPPRYKSPYFAHIFSGGYSANYYAYIWSEVLAADAFEYIQERGGLTRENGDHYRETILSRGGSREAMDLYLDFRGEEPGVEALLRRRGLEVKP
ncbi:M3 family metallopeptidase [Natronogracilivirga saccharolytica]|uniref:Dipeptidyl carboxypeptidase n=1 Tax=Natronogracilivirga saccharolytica TaxID=2812953 RepID=A0A8J7RNZ1_9BACT|nr:M3 family metallopeptidase [Natronogracilivirga saccharolytica]MBP3193264.1 M3 family metallopeptidase [Natronogracilivirga saccharolytica]